MIIKTRNKISSIKGKKMIFKYKGSRGQVEEFIGYIENTYSNVFTIRIIEDNILKSFSYNDVIIHKLVFKSV